MKTAPAHDLTTAESRRRAFNERIDTLTVPEAGGGYGMTFEDALRKMQEDPADAELLAAMGGATHEHKPRGADLSRPETRKALFDQRIEMLTARKPNGGEGLSFAEAIEEMKRNPIDGPLLRAMGADVSEAR